MAIETAHTKTRAATRSGTATRVATKGAIKGETPEDRPRRVAVPDGWQAPTVEGSNFTRIYADPLGTVAICLRIGQSMALEGKALIDRAAAQVAVEFPSLLDDHRPRAEVAADRPKRVRKRKPKSM